QPGAPAGQIEGEIAAVSTAIASAQLAAGRRAARADVAEPNAGDGSAHHRKGNARQVERLVDDVQPPADAVGEVRFVEAFGVEQCEREYRYRSQNAEPADPADARSHLHAGKEAHGNLPGQRGGKDAEPSGV